MIGSAQKSSPRYKKQAERHALKAGSVRHLLIAHSGYGVFLGYAFIDRPNGVAAFQRVTEERKTKGMVGVGL
jgi:hypothetical protein